MQLREFQLLRKSSILVVREQSILLTSVRKTMLPVSNSVAYAVRVYGSQQALRNEVREFAQNEIRPDAIELDQNEDYPAAILTELGDRRLTGITLPEEYGVETRDSSN